MYYKFIVTLIHIGDNIACGALLLYMYRYTAKVGETLLVVHCYCTCIDTLLK